MKIQKILLFIFSFCLLLASVVILFSEVGLMKIWSIIPLSLSVIIFFLNLFKKNN